MDGSCRRGFRDRPVWLLAVLVLLAAQASVAWPVFGGRAGLSDPRPIVSGRHPLHLVHGAIGAETFRDRSATATYDPAFQAGYPKTPVFDGGCRPAEAILFLSGAGFDAAAYKRGLFVLVLLAPLGFVLAARGAGVSRAGSVFAGSLGSGVTWSPPVRLLFDAGDIDVLIAGVAGVVFAGWLARYHWQPGVTSWCVLAAAAYVGWYAHPVIFLGLIPVVAVYFVAVAPRHGPAWHLGLFAVGLAGIGLNLWWLWDWAKFWWIRQPSADVVGPLPPWTAVLGDSGNIADLLGWHLLGWPLAATAAVGLGWMLHGGRRTAPAVLMLTAVLAFVVARLGHVWPTFAEVGGGRAAPLVPALAVVPVAGLAAGWWEASRVGRALLVATCCLPFFSVTTPVRSAFGLKIHPLAVGLTAEQTEFVRGLRTWTTADARTLIEPPDTARPGWNWTAMIPHLTGRPVLGGLDPEGYCEHAFCDTRGESLAGRPYSAWTDDELNRYCRRYNVGWVAVRSPAAIDRWRAYPPAKEVTRFRDGEEVVLFQLDRPRSYILAGSATWVTADRNRVVLSDVVPIDAPNPTAGGVPVKVVVLSLHHQGGFRVSPNVIEVERDPDPYDPIPMVRLRMPGSISRVSITWESP